MALRIVLICCLAAVTIMATMVRGANRETRDTRGIELPGNFRGLFAQLSRLFSPGSPAYAILQRFSPSGVAAQPIRNSPQVVRQSSAKTCVPACAVGQCCLLPPGSQFPTCQRSLFSGSWCSWNHYTGRNPSTTVALNRDTCPCMLGMACVSASRNKKGVCTFF